MNETASIPFKEVLDRTISMTQIEWWRPSSRFVVLRYTENGRLQEYGKRLDLDKRVFLDGFDDAERDEKLHSWVPQILEAVAAYRSENADLHAVYPTAFS